MTGRGIDQILPHPSSPELFEDYIHDARDYVSLAERESGPIPRAVAFDYPWGDALLHLCGADVRIVNLETSVTSSDDAWPDKGINYRMHPTNVGCLTAAGLDVAVLANNHVLDWGRRGLLETLETLRAAGIETVGAGRDALEADAVVVRGSPGGRRVLVAAAAEPESGVPWSWAASDDKPGIALLHELGTREADAIARRFRTSRRPGDIAVVSIHWGSNWGYEIPAEHVRFAHLLVERDVDVVYGHSSHHPRPIELHRGRLIVYGCGDLLNDYEGISGYEAFRNDLVLLYLLTFDGDDVALRMQPFHLRKMRLEAAAPADVAFLATTLADHSRAFGTRIFVHPDGSLGACAY